MDVINYFYSERGDVLDSTLAVSTASGECEATISNMVLNASSDVSAHAITITYKPTHQNSLTTLQMRNLLANFFRCTPHIKYGILVYDFDVNSNFHYHGTVICSDRTAKHLKISLGHFLGFSCIKGISHPVKWTEYVMKYYINEKEQKPEEVLIFHKTDKK